VEVVKIVLFPEGATLVRVYERDPDVAVVIVVITEGLATAHVNVFVVTAVIV
jgi:hypothetical protein